MKTLLFAVCVALGCSRVFAEISPPNDAIWYESGSFTTTGHTVVCKNYGTFSSATVSDGILYVGKATLVATITAEDSIVFIHQFAQVSAASFKNCRVYVEKNATLSNYSSEGTTFSFNQDFKTLTVDLSAPDEEGVGTVMYYGGRGWWYSYTHNQWVYILNTWAWGADKGWTTLY